MKACHGKVNNSDYWRSRVNNKFDSVWNNNLGKAQHTVAMEHNMGYYDFGLKDAHAGDFRRHLKTHSGEKSNKCWIAEEVIKVEKTV